MSKYLNQLTFLRLHLLLQLFSTTPSINHRQHFWDCVYLWLLKNVSFTL